MLSFPLGGALCILSVSTGGILICSSNSWILCCHWLYGGFTSGGVALAVCLLEPSWLFFLPFCKAIDIVSNRVSIPITDLNSIVVSVSVFNVYLGSLITL